MSKEFINPNWHVILLHLPLGVFVLGMLIEVFSFLYRHSSVRLVARGMIWLGALATLPAAMSGIYAFANVVRMELPPGMMDDAQGKPWHETAKAASGGNGLSGAQWDLLGQHAWSQGIATGVAVVLVTIGFGASDRWRRKLQLPLMAGLLFALVAMTYGAYAAGEMVYRHGTAVQVDQRRGGVPEASQPRTTESAAKEHQEIKTGVERYVPPLQLHVTLAGIVAALCFAALGMSLRAMSTADEWRDRDMSSARNLLDLETGPRETDELADARPHLDADAGASAGEVPAARFWLFASLAALFAALAGYWFLAGSDEMANWNPQNLWKAIKGHDRRLYHVSVGVSLVVLPLILALVARFARRSKPLLGLCSVVLLVALGAQIWLGVLLMFDTPTGSVYRFNRSDDTRP